MVLISPVYILSLEFIMITFVFHPLLNPRNKSLIESFLMFHKMLKIFHTLKALDLLVMRNNIVHFNNLYLLLSKLQIFSRVFLTG